MASEKVIQYFNRKFGTYNYRCRLQDYTDDEVRNLIKELKPKDWHELEAYLYTHTEDREVQAHLKGFDCAADRDAMVAHIKRLQEML